MRAVLVAAMLCAGCGGGIAWAGKWKQPTAFPAGSYMEMTLGGSGTTITGSGVQHREAGTDLNFTVSGTSQPVQGLGFTLSYADGTTEGFVYQQPDHDHIQLINGERSVSLVRQ